MMVDVHQDGEHKDDDDLQKRWSRLLSKLEGEYNSFRQLEGDPRVFGELLSNNEALMTEANELCLQIKPGWYMQSEDSILIRKVRLKGKTYWVECATCDLQAISPHLFIWVFWRDEGRLCKCVIEDFLGYGMVRVPDREDLDIGSSLDSQAYGLSTDQVLMRV